MGDILALRWFETNPDDPIKYGDDITISIHIVSDGEITESKIINELNKLRLAFVAAYITSPNRTRCIGAHRASDASDT